ncbi:MULTISPECIES: GNAT family N-acetyltransferase [Corynebacterium]|uniref:GNAT family N-acetyltransferase n=1 Tax=Corynebacterium TaxID=1716 RepID=UPI0008A4F6AB|nr:MULTISPECIES: GNAT family N-acetyltransferase [Corynebacterium]OFT87813.1 acetyltransferase [Corynebacterium sp. HMSC28B08]
MSNSLHTADPYSPTHAKDGSAITFRRPTEADRSFIERMFREAETFGDADRELPEGFGEDSHNYVGLWTEDQGGIIIQKDGRDIGAAWLRRGTEEEHCSGFVSADVPEVALALAPGHPGGGLGTILMERAMLLAKVSGAPGISLAVDFGNDRAEHVYERIGYKHRGLSESGECKVMYYGFQQ